MSYVPFPAGDILESTRPSRSCSFTFSKSAFFLRYLCAEACFSWPKKDMDKHIKTMNVIAGISLLSIGFTVFMIEDLVYKHSSVIVL